MTPRAAPAVVELGLHALAFAPAPEPGSLHDPRYAAWCRANLPADAWRPLDEDAALLAALAARAGPAWWALQLLPFAHRDVAGLVAAAAHPVAALDPRDAARPDAAEAIRALARDHEALVEVARADAALVARAYERSHASLITPLTLRAVEDAAPSLTLAAALAPALTRCDVALSFVLGARGRAYGDVLVLGAPCPWSDLPAERPAVLALHELAVTAAMAATMGDALARWAAAEGVALRAVESLTRGTALEGAWGSWRGEVDARGAEAVGAGDARVGRVLAALREG
ncbi:MAG: hypothetical protein U0324_33160 [Polyangiales bacterium]